MSSNTPGARFKNDRYLSARAEALRDGISSPVTEGERRRLNVKRADVGEVGVEDARDEGTENVELRGVGGGEGYAFVVAGDEVEVAEGEGKSPGIRQEVSSESTSWMSFCSSSVAGKTNEDPG